jgi:SAM-dependent methyltransferase
LDDQTFVEAHLPPKPARVLEVGCGQGGLARAIAELGYRVSAIDPNAPEGAIFEAVSLEEFADTAPFDAVVAILALHHITDLSEALGHIERLLRPGGALILREHAWDRIDERTAAWYLERRTAGDRAAPAGLEAWLAEWDAGHADLHGYAALRQELDARFTERFFAWTPYLYGELSAVSEHEEQASIDAGVIQALGFCYVGELAPAAV